MLIEETFGKSITNIYLLLKMEVGGLDTAECFIELNNQIIIEIPFSFNNDVWVKELNESAMSLFSDLSDIAVYHVNKKGKSVQEIADKHQRRKRSIVNRLRKFFFGTDISIKEYEPYHVEFRENQLKHIRNKKIVDFICYDDDSDKGLFLLDNGYLITETIVAPHGTGKAGLNYFCNIEDLISSKGNDFKKLSDKLA